MVLMRIPPVSITNTLIGLMVIYCGMYFLRLGDVAANGFGYAVGLSLGFVLNRPWIFNEHGRYLLSLVPYLLVLVAAYSANLAAMMFASIHLEINSYLAQAAGIVSYTVVGYLGCCYLAVPNRRAIRQGPTPQVLVQEVLSKPKREFARAFELSIVVPCYNEEQVLAETNGRLTDLLIRLINANKITDSSRIVYVDDGSRDRTWAVIESLAGSSPLVSGIKLSRNRGHQNALLAGLLTAGGEAIISVDADLQDDLAAIEQMLDCYDSGYEIVYGVRKSRHTDTFFKSFTARAYYTLLQMMGVDIVHNHADYRLISRRAMTSLKEYGEVNLFLRGIIPQLGYSSTVVYYDRKERFAGESKYPLRKMLSLAWQGITSFSTVPLRMITGLGMLTLAASICLSAWVFWVRLFTDKAIPGWASIVLPIYFIGGVQMLCLGIIGEYIAKIYLETKRRPRFFIEKMVNLVDG